MDSRKTEPVHPVDQIPPPEAVLDRLAENRREARLLRSLLKLSKRAVESRQQPATEGRSND